MRVFLCRFGEFSVARELAPAGLRSGPKALAVAAQPSGSKLPRHRFSCVQLLARQPPGKVPLPTFYLR
ncbi:hypothetical protein CEQ51_00420 [Pseudomonas thivervalensis]|uniref:Uncharacterized protein n=1 Tax=Pseudomonas thivervalensis TaxID=86265 RepID=A0A2Z4ZKY7_9PSED|nr:hypothetical protein CE140_00420 [Pseudomonas thivervalensis]AXA58602.1 hypothetical protein CEQ51_00420 [Pseudomonas thivervalensis]